MLEYQFSFQDQQIKFTIDAMGREKCYLNDDLIEKLPMSWFKRSVDVEIKLDNKVLRLNRKVISFQAAEYQVSLYQGEELIAEQTKQYWARGLASDEQDVTFNKDESNWIQEIKSPKNIYNLAFLLYFITIAVDFFSIFGINKEDSNVIAMMFIIFIGLYGLFTVVNVFRKTFSITVEPDTQLEKTTI